MRRLLILLLLSVTLIGCHRSFALFPLEVRLANERDDLALEERPGRTAEEEGALRSTGTRMQLLLERPYRVGESSLLLVVRFSSFPRGVEVIARDENGGPLGVARVGLPPAGVGGASSAAIGLRLPAGVTLSGVELGMGEHASQSGGDDSDHDGERSLRLEGMTLVRERTGVGMPDDLGAGSPPLFFSPGVDVRSWARPLESGRRRWSIAPGTARSWAADLPVEIRYSMPEERYEIDGEVAAEIEPPIAHITAGDRRFELELRPGTNRVVLYPEIEGVVLSEVVVESTESGFSLDWIGPLDAMSVADGSGSTNGESPGNGLDSPDSSPPPALPVDLGTLLRYPPQRWRESSYELFSWSLYPQVLFVDTISYEVQSRFFKRLAFYVEKRGYRGTLLTDDELAGRHGYNAHNYNAVGLSSFFNAADRAGLRLNAEEELLRGIAESYGIIRWTDTGYEPGAGGVLGVSHESSLFPTLRELLISHEAYHGVYYAEPSYVDAVDKLWEALLPDQQRYWRLLLSGLQYDVSDEYLLRNEYHAFLLQQPLASASWYFEVRSAERLARWYPDEAAWVREYVDAYGGTHRRQAALAQAALFSRTGLIARDVYCLEPVEVP